MIHGGDPADGPMPPLEPPTNLEREQQASRLWLLYHDIRGQSIPPDVNQSYAARVVTSISRLVRAELHKLLNNARFGDPYAGPQRYEWSEYYLSESESESDSEMMPRG